MNPFGYHESTSVNGFKITKGMAFIGCSFTWGEGLQFYSNLPTVTEDPHGHYDFNLLTTSHYKYIEKNRYPRLVADHFNTFEIVNPNNGGCNETNIEWWTDSLNLNKSPRNSYNYTNHQYEISEISHLFFQFTEWTRNFYYLDFNNELGILPPDNDFETTGVHRITYKYLFTDYKIYLNMLLNKKQLTLDEFIDIEKQKQIINIQNWLQKIESLGIKVYVLNWTNELNNLIISNNWLRERLITIKYKNREYYTFESIMARNPEMVINTDKENFIDTPKNKHSSLLLHQIISKNIIDKIKDIV